MSVTRWQQLGAFVNEISKAESKLDAFAAAGGRWVVPLLAQLGYSDDHDPACVENNARLHDFQVACTQRGIACGGWFNGWNGGDLGTTPAQDADKVASIVKSHDFDFDGKPVLVGPVVLDLELAYQNLTHPLPQLLWEVRRRITTRGLAVSTNSPNDSMPWNGKNHFGDYRASVFRLGIRVLPQWYNAPAYGHGTWMRPDQTMQWLQAHGFEDNLYDPLQLQHRALPLSYVHGTLEVTGLEGADLAGELAELRTAKASYGYSYGLSVYLLEDCPQSDLDMLAQERGKLILV